jgi:hypothetical protein
MAKEDPAKHLILVSDRQTIICSPDGQPDGEQTTTLHTMKQGTSAPVQWSLSDGRGQPLEPVRSYLNIRPGSATMTADQFAQARNGTGAVRVKAELEDGGVRLCDTLTIAMVRNSCCCVAGQAA